MGMNLFDLSAKLSLDSSNYESGIEAAKGVVDGFSKAAGIAFAAAAAAFTKFAKDAVNTGMEFDKAMSQVAATMGTTVDQIQDLRKFAMEMGASTQYSAVEAAQALNYMALAGYDAQKSMSMLPIVLNLAAAGDFDLARASDMVTDAESALGLTTEQTAAMVDQMAKTASKSNTSVEQLGEAMLAIGGTAQFMAGGTDRLQTVLGLLADNGIKGSTAGMHLRNMLLKLASPTKEGAMTIEQLGLQVYDSEGKMRDFQDIILDLGEAMKDMTDAEKVVAISDMFNARDLSSVNALLGTSVERWNELGSAIADASGSAGQMAETQLDNLNGDITIMKSALEGVKIQFSDGITPAIRDLVQRITKVLSSPKTQKFLKEVGEAIGNVITRIREIVSNVLLPKLISLFEDGGKKIKIFGGIALGLVATIKTVTTVMEVLAGTLSPTGLLLKGVGLLIGAFAAAGLAQEDYVNNMGYLTESQRELVNSIDEMNEAHNETADAYKNSIAPIMEERDRVTELWQELQKLVDEDGKVLEGQEDRVNFILGQLNDALGTEYSMNDGIIEQYQDMQGEIDNLIQKRAAESLLAAKEASYTEALQKREEALRNAGRAYDELQKAQTNLRDAQDAYNDAYERYAYLSDGTEEGEDRRLRKMREYEEAVRDAQLAVNKWDSTYKTASNNADQYYSDVERYEKAQMDILQGNYTEAQNLLTKDYDYSLEIQRKKAADNIIEAAKYKKMLNEKKAAVLEFQRKVIEGQEGYSYEMLQEMKRSFNAEVEEARKAGLNVGTSLAIGMSQARADVEARASSLIRSAINRMRAEAQIASPSKKGRKIGANIGESVGLGLEDSEEFAEDSAANLTKGVLSNLEGNADFGVNARTRVTTEDRIIGLLNDIKERLGFDVVLDDGTLVGRIDKRLGQTAQRKARGNA